VQLRYLPVVEATCEDRRCGSCSLCCSVLRVDPLRKLGGVDCVHQRAGSEAPCGIHGRPERPALCDAYRCAWLRGHFGPDDRPDRLGAVLDISQRVGLPLLAIREARPGAFEASERLQAIARAARETMEVRITCADDVMNADRPYRVWLPGGEERRIEGEWTTVLRDGEVAAHERMPRVERIVRRIALAWQRRRLRGYRGADTRM
jgi:hypothetical protein